MRYIVVIFLYILSGCLNNSSQNYDHIGSLDRDSLETGKWKYFESKNGNPIEEGEFEKGVRTGKWRYFPTPSDSINWIPYSTNDNSIRTNIPDFLNTIEKSDSIVVFKPLDSTQVFNLVIGNGFNKQVNTFEKYKELLFQDLKSRNIKLIDTTNNYLQTASGRLLYTFVSAIDSNGFQFYLFNIARILEGGKLIEVTLRSDVKYENRARKVFFSIIPNLFVGGRRFITIREMAANYSTIKL